MKETIEKITAWIQADKKNMWLAIGGLAAVLVLIFHKKIFKPARRRIRHRAPVHIKIPRHRRSLPRSVGMKRATAKKPWQIKGSEAARRHMARLRKMR